VQCCSSCLQLPRGLLTNLHVDRFLHATFQHYSTRKA
jgi:hypothetical protein